MSSTETQENASPLSALKYAAGTDIGKKREENQDSFGVIENERFRAYLVADGMGGVKGGAIASSLAIKHITESLKDTQELTVGEIARAVQGANSQIFERGAEDSSLSGMGTTLTGIAFEGSSMFLINVGDSRVYRFRNQRIKQLSEDHTLVRELLRSGTITKEQAENHPVAHMLTRSLGPTPEVEIDCLVCDDGPARGDIYLLCSDGLYNLVTERDMIEILTSESMDGAIQRCINLANQRGGTDNITVILVQVSEEFPVGPEEFDQSEAGSIGLEDTVELYAEQVMEAQPATETPEQADGADSQVPESPSLQGAVDIEQISAALGASQQASDTIGASASVGQKLEIARSAVSRPGFLVFTLVLGIVLGVGGAYVFSPESPAERPQLAELPKLTQRSQVNEVRAPVALEAEAAKMALVLPEMQLHNQAPNTFPALNSMSGTELGSDNQEDSATGFNGLARHEVDNVTARKTELRTFLAAVAEKLDTLGKPLSGALAEKLRAAARQKEQLRAQFDAVQTELDVTARKLAVWYGRQKRLQTADPINMASEVAVASASVREKREIFERATYAYLQEAEILRYNPTDQAQDDKVKNLMRVRKQRMAELAREVQDAVENEVRSADRHIAELTLERDKIQAQLENVQQDVEYAQVVMGSDSGAKSRLKSELTKKQQVAQAELKELEALLPETQDNGY